MMKFSIVIGALCLMSAMALPSVVQSDLEIESSDCMGAYKDCVRAGKNSRECRGGYKTCLKGDKKVVATAKPVQAAKPKPTAKPVKKPVTGSIYTTKSVQEDLEIESSDCKGEYKDCVRAGKNSRECMGGYKTCLKGDKKVVATAKPVKATAKPVAPVTAKPITGSVVAIEEMDDEDAEDQPDWHFVDEE